MIEIFKDNNFKKYFFVGLFFLALVFAAVFEAKSTGNYTEIKLSQSLNNEVIQIKKHKSWILIELKGEPNGISIRESSNYKYEPKQLSRFLQLGDTIIKHECSDTLIIKNNKGKFKFVIEDKHYNNFQINENDKEKWRRRRTIMNEFNDCK